MPSTPASPFSPGRPGGPCKPCSPRREQVHQYFALKQLWVVVLLHDTYSAAAHLCRPVAYQVVLHDQDLLGTQKVQEHPCPLVYLADL